MLLKIDERMALLSVLPAEGTFATLKQVRKLREELSFADDAEMAKCDVVQKGGQIKWDRSKDSGKDVEISETMKEAIVAGLKGLNDKKTLREGHMSIYERFVSPPEE